MFIIFNQLASGEPIALDVANIKEFHPEVVDDKSGTLIHFYRGELPWIVSQDILKVAELCNLAKKGKL